MDTQGSGAGETKGEDGGGLTEVTGPGVVFLHPGRLAGLDEGDAGPGSLSGKQTDAEEAGGGGGLAASGRS